MSEQDRTQGFARKNWAPIALLAAAALAAGALMVQEASHDRVLAAQAAEIEEAQQAISDLEAEQASNAEQAVSDGMGVSRERVTADTDAITQLMSTSLKWTNGEEYSSARDRLELEWGLDPEGQFLTSFMPPGPGRVDSEGNFHSYIDAKGLNSAFGGVDVDVVSAKGSEYRYLVQATSTAVSFEGAVTSSSRSVVLITMQQGGVVSEISGFAVLGKTRGT